MTRMARTSPRARLPGRPPATPLPSARSEPSARPVRPVDAAAAPDIGRRAYAVGVGAYTLALGVFSLVRVGMRPPHEDETLALFTGRESLPGLLHSVLGERGGAPL